VGLQLPPELIEALSWVGCTWPEADETKLFDCGEYWGAFAERAAEHAEAATTAVLAMLAENQSPGLDAFRVYWEKLSGEDGYLVDCGIVAGAVSIVFYAAGGLVLTLKVLVIVQLIAFAVILAAAIAAAFFTLGASLAAAAAYAVTVNRTITTLVNTTIIAIRGLGAPLSELVREHLSKEIDRLEGRPIHSSEQGVDEFDTPEEREQEQQEYERRREELAKDPATGQVTDSTRREAEVALGLERMGTVTPPVERADHEGADFTDGNGQDWDVKGFQTRPGQDGDYTRAAAETSIQKEIIAGEYVALDTSKLSQADRDDLKELVESHPEWVGKVVIY
jgi:flagellar basal body-associated protein FliL